MSKMSVIETSGLSIGYAHKSKRRVVLHDSLEFQLFTGELTSLLGLNGAGKSTLIRTLCGFQPPIKGNIYLHNRALSDYSRTEMSRMIGVVLTEKTNAGGMTVFELVALGRHPYTGFFGSLKATDKTIVTESLKAVGLENKISHFISELSDGERQKAMIAKVLAQQCPIIFLDEPTAFLDVASRLETMSLLHRLAVEQDKAILLSTHDLDLAIQMSDRLWLLDNKRSFVNGTPEDLILNGIFATFFNKKDLTFNVTTGKLAVEKKTYPIVVEGDTNTAYWVGNALKRNGFHPSPENESDICICCFNPNKISLRLPGQHEIMVYSIAELTCELKKIKLFDESS